MENRRRGFTLTELIVGVVVMVVTLGVATMSLTSTDQTPKREAERIAMYLTRLTQKSDRIKVSFDVELKDNKLAVSWKKHGENMEADFELSPELNYIPRFNINDIKDDKVKKWTYQQKDYPNGVKIAAISTTKYPGTNTERYYKNGHRYIKITNDNNGSIKGKQHLEYYVLITSRDVT